MFNFDPYCVKRNEELNKEFLTVMLCFISALFMFAIAAVLGRSLLMDKPNTDIFQNSASEYVVTIDGVTEYWSLYADDGVYYNTDKEMVFDASGDALLIYTDGQCTGKSTNYTIRLKN